MIYVTGDIHANIDIGKLSSDAFPEQKNLTKDDFLIVCGDFGLVWDESREEIYWRKWLSSKNFTTLWVDGNHENFELLYTIPTTEMFGGIVREIAPNVYHMCRGQVLSIDGKKFFVMGGARSHDKIYRKEHVSWWKEEMPSSDEMQRAIDALDANDWQVDYVITHCAPNGIQSILAEWYENDSMTSFLEHVRTNLDFKKWFFGHYHTDKEINEQFIAMYYDILRIS